MADVLLRMLCGVTLGLALVLLSRRPACRLFGAGSSFTLWLLPVVLMLAPLLPWQFPPPARVMLPVMTVTPHASTVAIPSVIAIDWASGLMALWMIGVAVGLLRLAMRYFGLLRGMRRAPATWTRKLTEAASNLDAPRVRIHDTGPAVLWALPRALILLPKDFVERYGDAPARELVLHHELTHVRRGDAWWTLAMEIASVLLWFHPLAWFSRPRFRLDQELACDAASLRTLPNCTASYARTLLDSIAVQPAPALIPWLVESQLKERIAMITRVPPGALRRRVGFVAVAALLAGGLFAVGGQMPAEAAAQHSPASKPPSVDVHYNNDNPPRYPVDALRNGEQGTVMLRIHVDANGTVTRVDIDKAKTTTTSAELQAAAVTAAENWKFHAGVKGSQPSGGWMTVPVRFALQPAASS